MTESKKSSNEQNSIALKAELSFLNAGALDISKIENGIRAINDYSAGLSFSFKKEGVLGYAGLIESQRKILTSALEVGENLKIEHEGMASFINTAIMPVSGAMADIGLVSANATRLLGAGELSMEQFKVSDLVSNLAIGAIEAQQSLLKDSFTSLDITSFKNFANDVIPSLQTVSMGISEMVRSLPTFPSEIKVPLPDLEIAQEIAEVFEEKEISEHQERLDSLLSEIDPELVEFRKAAWDVFNSKGKDYIGQASSSMRRLVDSLLRCLAPEKEVVETDYFKNNPNAKDNKGRPNRKARLLYVLSWDQNKAEHLDRLTKGFLEAYGHLSAWDHVPLKEDGFVHGALITVEGHLISILSLRKK